MRLGPPCYFFRTGDTVYLGGPWAEWFRKTFGEPEPDRMYVIGLARNDGKKEVRGNTAAVEFREQYVKLNNPWRWHVVPN